MDKLDKLSQIIFDGERYGEIDNTVMEFAIFLLLLGWVMAW